MAGWEKLASDESSSAVLQCLTPPLLGVGKDVSRGEWWGNAPLHFPIPPSISKTGRRRNSGAGW